MRYELEGSSWGDAGIQTMQHLIAAADSPWVKKPCASKEALARKIQGEIAFMISFSSIALTCTSKLESILGGD